MPTGNPRQGTLAQGHDDLTPKRSKHCRFDTMASARRAAEMGEALVIASQDNKIIDICRLLTMGADVNYVDRWMQEGEEISTTPLIRAALCGHADAV